MRSSPKLDQYVEVITCVSYQIREISIFNLIKRSFYCYF